MNHFIILSLLLLSVPAWAQQSNGSCILQSQMQPWTQLDSQTAMVQAGRKQYIVTVPDCGSFFGGFTSEIASSAGSRVCEGDSILYYDTNFQLVETCVITDIVRIRINPQTNAVEVNEFED